MGPLFAIATDLSPHDAAWRQVTAEAEAVADLAAPILGFRPEVVLASLTGEPTDLSGAAPETPAGDGELRGMPPNTPAQIHAPCADRTPAQLRAQLAAPGSSVAQILEEQAAQGRTLAFVLPAILDFSIFQRQALVEIVRESQRRAPSLAVHYDDVDPCHRLVVQAFADALCERLAGSEVPPARLGVLAVASGQGDARARAEAYAMMRLLWEQLGAARGEIAFVRHARPSVPEVLDRCLAEPLHWVAAPLVLWPGAILDYAEVLFDDFRRAHPEAPGFQLAPPVAASPHIRAWLAERLLALFRAHRAREESRAPSLIHASAARESCVIGPEASCTMDILPRPLGPDLAYGPGVIAEIVGTDGLARLLEHAGLTAERVFVKVTWHGYAPGTFTDAAALDQLLSALPGRAIVLEGHSTGRNLGGAAFDWESEARAHRAWLRDQEAE
ncbi:MAG TPA: CbiX/SirB N-terminal domain-containing protein, partial [Kofleriaceae bacterium]|nr:CbiX/SirB N-terminal domain-containing protein [Kofleriaceae bacterium]